MAPAAPPPTIAMTNPTSSWTTAFSFSQRARFEAPMGAPAPAMPPITAGMMDTIDATIGEPGSKLIKVESP